MHSESGNSTSRPPLQLATAWPWVLFAVAGLYLFMLGSMPLNNPDEGRYAEIPREMVASGDWVTPRLNDVLYFEKPPLVYWANALSLELLGPSEWAIRLVPVLFAFLGITMTVITARTLFSPRAGWLAGVMLASSVFYFGLARILLLDMAVSVLIAGTLFCFQLGMRLPAGRARFGWFMGMYAFAALATLAKGLIGFLLPGAVMFLWILCLNQWKRLLPLHLLPGLALFLLIALPWHLLAAAQNPQWAHFYFVREHWLRFTTTTHDRVAPFWYFIPVILGGLIPWTGFLPYPVKDLLRKGWSQRKQHLDAWFLVVWAVFIFLFFSRSQSKLSPYILPIFPALAVMLAGWVDRCLKDGSAARLRGGLWTGLGLLGLLGLAVAVLALKPDLIRQADLVEKIRPQAFLLALSLLAAALFTWLQVRQSRFERALLGVVLGMSCLLSITCAVLPHLVKRNTKSLAQIVNTKAASTEQTYHYKGFFHDFVFYTGRFANLVDTTNELEPEIDPKAKASGRFISEAELLARWEGPERLWVLGRRSELFTKDPAQPRLLDRPELKYHVQGDDGRHLLITNKP